LDANILRDFNYLKIKPGAGCRKYTFDRSHFTANSMPQLLMLSRKCDGEWRYEDNSGTAGLYLEISGIFAPNIWGIYPFRQKIQFLKVLALMRPFRKMAK